MSAISNWRMVACGLAAATACQGASAADVIGWIKKQVPQQQNTPAPQEAPEGQAPQQTAAEKRMQGDSEKFNQTVLGGALVGAGIGAVVCGGAMKVMNKHDKDIARAAALCGAGGGLLGGLLGKSTADDQQKKVDENRVIQASAEDIKRDNDNLQSYIDSSEAVLAEGKKRIAKINADLKSKRITAQQAAEARKREEQNVASMQGTLEQARTARDKYQQAAAQAKTTAKPGAKDNIDNQIAVMNKSCAQLEANISDYNKALSVSKA